MTGAESVVLRVGVDGVVTRVPLVVDEQGSSGALLRSLIGCSLFEAIELDDRLDMWADEEALVGVDLGDRVALVNIGNPVAAMIVRAFGVGTPVFGAVVLAGRVGGDVVALDTAQLQQLESLAGRARKLFGEALAARAARRPVSLTIRVEVAYSDGHESSRTETVEVEAFEDLDGLWDQLWEHTGDGHGVGQDLGCCSTVTILEAPDRPELVGLSNEWC